MKNVIVAFSSVFIVLLFTNCVKENHGPAKQYLFDGLPYYLNDTLFAEEMLTGEMYALPYIVRFDSKGMAWILDTFGQLYRYDRWKKELINWNSTKILGTDPPNNIRDIFIDSKDRIWGTQYNQLYLIDGTSFKRMRFGDKEDGPIGLSEDKNGIIHFCGYNDGKEYVCDGNSITRTDPIFASDDYHIYQIHSNRQRNLWYVIDQTPHLYHDEESYVVMYINSTDYVMLPEQKNSAKDELSIACNIVFDSDNTPIIYTMNGLFHVNRDGQWKLLAEPRTSNIPNNIFIDHDDQVWAALGRGENTPFFMALVKDGQWIGESDSMKAIKDRNSVVHISFPDENTVWVCTSFGLLEFKK